jgi:hypothetical protein
MKPKLLLRIASVIIFLHAIGHFLGVASVTKGETEEQNMVIHAMTDHRFPVMGAVHSFADFLHGFGWVGEVFLLLTAYLFWFTGSLYRLVRADDTGIYLFFPRCIPYVPDRRSPDGPFFSRTPEKRKLTGL